MKLTVQEKSTLRKYAGLTTEEIKITLGGDHVALEAVDSYFNEKLYLSLESDEFPGCCGMTVFHDFPEEDAPPEVLGILLRACEENAKARNKTFVLATHLDKQTNLKKAMALRGWNIISTFVNKRTKNKVNVYGKDVAVKPRKVCKTKVPSRPKAKR